MIKKHDSKYQCVCENNLAKIALVSCHMGKEKGCYGSLLQAGCMGHSQRSCSHTDRFARHLNIKGPHA